MALSTVVIKFISMPSVGTRFTVSDDWFAGISETFVSTRVGLGEVSLDPATTLSGILKRLHQAVELDSNVLGIYTLSVNVADLELTITATNVNSFFTEVFNDTAGAVTVTINNVAATPVLTIDTVTASAPTIGTPETTVKLSATTSAQATFISSPISSAVAINPFVFETPRADWITINMNDGTSFATKLVSVPLLLTAYFSIDVKQTPSGGTLTINRLAPLTPKTGLLLTFEYSIDFSTWETSNSWSGLEPGEYTVYVRDNLGAGISIPVTIGAFTANLVDYDPIVEVSNANALRFKLNEVWDTNGISKNVENTLSHEENSKINLQSFIQPFQKNDVINTQIKTNYATVTAKILDLSKNETALTVVQTTENMNVKDVRDGKIKILNNGTLGIYFGSGNTYDPDTLSQIGSYNLYEYLMDWINVGDYVNVEGIGWGKVDTIYAPTSAFEFYYISVNLQNTLNYANDKTVKITTVYNVADFNRFEFEIDLSARQGVYYVVVNVSDPEFGDKEYVSEWIDVQEIHENCHQIKYYSTKNNEINYGTGINFTIRVPYMVNLQWTPNTSQEIYVTDTNTINLDSKVREFYRLNLMPLPTAMAQKIILILAHNRIFIDGVSYLLEGEPESKPIGVTNLYQISANLVKANYVFDAKRDSSLTEILIGTGVPLSIDASARGLLFIQ